MIDLLIAFAIGLIVGLERGWHAREAAEGTRLAGLRTFTLIGLFGGVCALLAAQFSTWLLACALLGLGVVLAVGHYQESEDDGEKGVTTVIAAMLTFALAALAVSGFRLEAVAITTLMAALLSLKTEIHGWLQRVERLELHTALQLLVVAAAVLPFLPEQPVGPWGAIVPRQIGWLVLLISGLSFAGYLAVKLIGARYGLLAMGAFGGMASSTAVVLHLSARLRQVPAGRGLLTAAILAACTVMAPRVFVLTGLIAPSLMQLLALPVAAMTVPLLLAIVWQLRRAQPTPDDAQVSLSNPMSLLTSAQFAALMAGVMLLVAAARHWLGDAGILVAATLGGVLDADAISLSLAEMNDGGVAPRLLARGVLIALVVNNSVKAVSGLAIGGRAAGGVALALALSGAIGATFAALL